MSREIVVQCDICGTQLDRQFESPDVIVRYEVIHCGKTINMELRRQITAGISDVCSDCNTALGELAKDKIWMEMEESRSLED